jgi:CheY-like chemotaxis protein
MKILIVDDSRAMRMIVRKTLRQAGYGNAKTAEAANGIEGLTQIASFKPDVVMTDWNMPEMGGHEFLLRLHSLGFKGTAGVVSSAATPQMRQAAAAAGASFILPKPFTPHAFENVLAEAGFPQPGRKAALRPSNAAPVGACSQRQLDVDGIRMSLSGAFARPCDVTPARKPLDPYARTKWVVCPFKDSAGTIAAYVVTDMQLGMCLGAALTLVPMGAVKDAVRSGQVPPNIKANMGEVFNLLLRVLEEDGNGLTLGDLATGLKRMPPEVRARLRSGTRIDVTVQVRGYPSGTMMLLQLAAAKAAA